MSSEAPTRRRPDGERSRRAILRAAAELATVEGLEGLSIGRLADETGMSKSGLYAHFASKQALQLATVETANEIFDVEVVQPALEAPAGRERLVALCDAYLSHLQRDVFPGGCFFAATAADFGMRPGPVRDAIKESWTAFEGLVAELIEEARAKGEIAAEPETEQLAFELIGYLGGANASFVLFRDPLVLERARRAVRTRLAVGP